MHDLRSAIAKMFWVGFHGTEPDDELMHLLSRGVGGVVLFARNLESPAQAASLIAQIKRRAGRPLPVAIDHEGGRVMRLGKPFTQTPPMRAIGKVNDTALSRRVGYVFARELRAVGFDMNFAPVLDVDTNPANTVIASRSFGSDTALVSRMGMAMIDGIQGERLAACAKHFPGHGDTAEDSHTDLPRIRHDRDRLERIELPPFVLACKGRVAAVMVAHVVYEAFDPKYPATMSQAILEGVLRKQIGYQGLVIIDDIEMKAIAEHYGDDQPAVSVMAGADVLLCCHRSDSAHHAIDTLIHAAEKNPELAEKIARANQRLDVFNQRYTRDAIDTPDLSPIGCDEHKQIVEGLLNHPACTTGDDTTTDPTETSRWLDD